MSTRQMRRRLAKVQEKVSPEHDGTYTLEELCRLWWKQDKAGFINYVNGEGRTFRVFMDTFEREDAERAARR